jgi:YD repeat-containing protein
MAVIKCQLCGSDIKFDPPVSRAQCEHCGIYLFFDENGEPREFRTNEAAELSIEEVKEAESATIAEQVITEKAESKPKKRRTFKIALIAVLCVAVLIPLFSFANSALKLSEAKRLIDQENYEKAYLILMKLESKEAKSLIKKFEWKYTTYVSKYENETATTTKYTYNSDGKKTSHEIYYGNALKESMITQYNSKGNISRSQKTFPSSPSNVMTELYFYNDLDLVDHYVYQVRGNTVHEYFYEYDSNGNVIKKTYADSVSSYEMIFSYNDDGTVREAMQFDNLGTLMLQHVYEYDLRGNLLFEKEYRKYTGNVPKILNSYEYDRQGRKIKHEIPSEKMTYLYKYDKQGNLIEEKALRSGKEISVKKHLYSPEGFLKKSINENLSNGISSETLYKHDKYGNVTEVTQILEDKTMSVQIYQGYECYYHP